MDRTEAIELVVRESYCADCGRPEVPPCSLESICDGFKKEVQETLDQEAEVEERIKNINNG